MKKYDLESKFFTRFLEANLLKLLFETEAALI